MASLLCATTSPTCGASSTLSTALPQPLTEAVNSTVDRLSSAGGAHWTAVNTGLTDAQINALAIDPTTPTTLYVGTPDGVFKSSDGAEHWTAVNTGLPNVPVGKLALDPTSHVLYAAAGCEGWALIS